MYKIVCFGGGGIRGIFQSHFISLLLKSNGRIFNSVNLISGTSVGSFVAAALSLGNKVNFDDMSKTIQEETKYIFTDIDSPSLFLKGIFKRSIFDVQKIHDIAKKCFGGLKLSSVEKDLLITGTAMINMSPRIFSNMNKSDKNLFIHDIVTSSCSAPIFLLPISLIISIM